MTKQVQTQGTLHCQQKSVLVFLSCIHIWFNKQTLLAMTGSKISHSHHGNACSLCASVSLELWDMVTYCHLENSCLQDQMYSRCRFYTYLWQVYSVAVESSFFLPTLPFFFFSLVVFTVTEMEKTYWELLTRKHFRNTFSTVNRSRPNCHINQVTNMSV